MRSLVALSLSLCIGCGGTAPRAATPAATRSQEIVPGGPTGSGASATDPVRACHAVSPRTDYQYVAEYRCPDGAVPLGGDPARGAAARLGNVGEGPDGHILDLYEIPCATGAVRLYVDMYHCPAGVEAEPDMSHLTREQLAALALGIRSLHSDPYSPRAQGMRAGLLQWLIATPQVSVVVCAGLGPMLPSGDAHAYASELMLSMAASVIEDGRDPADPVTATTHGILGMLVYYQAVVAAEGASARVATLDQLVGAAQSRTLPSMVASAVAGCDLTHMGVHY